MSYVPKQNTVHQLFLWKYSGRKMLSLIRVNENTPTHYVLKKWMCQILPVCEINFRLFGGFDTASWKNENFKHFPVTPSHIPDRQLHVFLQSIP